MEANQAVEANILGPMIITIIMLCFIGYACLDTWKTKRWIKILASPFGIAWFLFSGLFKWLSKEVHDEL